MNPNFSLDIRRFLDLFFGEGNLPSLEGIYDPDSSHAKIRPFVDRLAKEPEATVLPYIDSKKKVTWFGLAFNDAQYSQLDDGLTAFMGPSFSTFHRNKVQDKGHPVASYVHEITSGRYFAFEADNAHVMAQLQLMFSVWKRRPANRQTISRDMSHLLRDFYTSLEAKDRMSAEASYESIKGFGQLSSQNILFLQIQMLSVFESWDELFSLNAIREVIASRRPIAVTETLLTGLYKLYILKFEQSADVEGAVQSFKEEVWPLYGNLFQSRRGLRSIESIKCHVLRAAALPEHNVPIEDLKKLFDNEVFYRNLLTRARSEDPKTITSHSYLQAQQEMDKGHVDIAFNILLSLSPGLDRTIGMLECAFLLQDLDSMKQSLEAFETLHEDQKSEILSNRRLHATMQALQTMENASHAPARSIPGNWNEWLASLGDLDEGHAIEIAKQGAAQWGLQQLQIQDSGLANLYTNLRAAEGEHNRERKLRLSVTHLLVFFRKDEEWPRQEWSRVYILLLGHLLRGSSGSTGDIRYYRQILQEIGQLNFNVEEYQRLLQPALDWVQKYGGKTADDSIVELLDTLIHLPCPDQAIRLRLLHATVSYQRSEMSQSLTELRGRLIPHSWPEWFEIMGEHAATSDFLLDFMPEKESMEWGHNVIDQMIELLVDPYPYLEQKMEHVAPRLVNSALQAETFPRQELELFYETLLMLMNAKLSRNYENTQRFVSMMDGMLRLHPESAEVRWNEVEDWFSGTPFTAIADQLVDTFDLFFDSPLAHERMTSLWNRWGTHLLEELISGPRLRISHWLRIGERVGGLYEQRSRLKEALANELLEDPIERLGNQTITIFTLREKPAVRAIEYLRERNPALQLRHCTDDRLTDRAKEYARNSDICVVVTTCISHALTYGIGEYLQRTPVYPRSSGESSIIDAIEQYARKAI